MRIELHLEEHETQNDITPLTLIHALYKFVDEHNRHNANRHDFDGYIFMRDIADIIIIMSNSADRYYKKLKGEESVEI